MSGLQTFEGDLLLEDTPDGGDIRIENNLFVSDRSFNTAIYLSLFGGNKDDPAKVKNSNEWWGNTLNDITEHEKLKSRFQYIITGFPMTVKNIKEAETAVVIDLQWILDEKIADEILPYVQVVGKNQLKLTMEIRKDKLPIFKNVYSLPWGVGNGDSI